ncbi:MAG: 3-hydroxyacyl-ACP dehydratase FabZ [Candidatus Omnitrophica bacterium]|nr:3-hydroxyacyl-ACP dehydratase FabZ [Candidatus Omnitrophota bacterium]
MLNNEAIQRLLPQRYPFLLIDTVLECIPKKKVVAVKNVTINEPFFAGHFPGAPVMPGVLIIEAMAQASIVLVAEEDEENPKKKSYYLGSVKIRFRHPVVPGDRLMITVEPIKLVSGAAIVSVRACVEDKEVALGEISLSIKEG